MQRKGKGGGRQTGRDSSVSGKFIESSGTSLILTVSWVLTSGVAASTPILSSVTLSVFVAVTDSPGVTLRLQCTIRHPFSPPVPGGSQSGRQHSPITPLKPSMSGSPGTPLPSLLSVHWARTWKFCQRPHDPAFTLKANYNTPTAPALLLP